MYLAHDQHHPSHSELGMWKIPSSCSTPDKCTFSHDPLCRGLLSWLEFSSSISDRSSNHRFVLNVIHIHGFECNAGPVSRPPNDLHDHLSPRSLSRHFPLPLCPSKMHNQRQLRSTGSSPLGIARVLTIFCRLFLLSPSLADARQSPPTHLLSSPSQIWREGQFPSRHLYGPPPSTSLGLNRL